MAPLTVLSCGLILLVNAHAPSAVSERFRIVLAFSCERAKTIRRRYVWKRILFVKKEKQIRFQTKTDIRVDGVLFHWRTKIVSELFKGIFVQTNTVYMLICSAFSAENFSETAVNFRILSAEFLSC